jgi:hypothetical protein
MLTFKSFFFKAALVAGEAEVNNKKNNIAIRVS